MKNLKDPPHPSFQKPGDPAAGSAQANYIAGLEYRETLYRRVLESTQEGFVLGDAHCVITDVNDALCKLTGYSPGELVGKYMWEIYDDQTQACIAPQKTRMVLSRDRRFEGRLRTREGGTVPVKVHGNILTDDLGRVFGNGAFIVDLTRQKETEALLRQSLEERDQALKRLNGELAEATHYVRSVLPEPMDAGGIATQWKFLPAATLGGDTFGYQWLDQDHFALYLIDVSGHGVGPALLSVSVVNMLRSQALPDTDFREPGQVLEALNTAFPGEKHNFMFFTMWYGVYNRTTRELKYASGGHPPALFLEHLPGRSPKTTKLAVKNMILGAMPHVAYAQESVFLKNPGCLYVFSDGAFEIIQPDGAFWGMDGFCQYMETQACTPGDVLDALVDHVRSLTGSQHLGDDLTVLEARFL